MAIALLAAKAQNVQTLSRHHPPDRPTNPVDPPLHLEPNSGSYRLARQALRRFIVPLTQASQFLALGPSVRRCVQRVVLRGMLTNGTAYGAWDAATWLTVSDAAGCFRSNVLGVA